MLQTLQCRVKDTSHQYIQGQYEGYMGQVADDIVEWVVDFHSQPKVQECRLLGGATSL